MRILQVNVVCGIGSTGRIATDIHAELIENGHESMIAFGREDAKNCDNAYRIGLFKDIIAGVLMTRLFDKHGAASKQATRDFCAVIDQYQPDLVHLHNIHGYYLHIETLMTYLKKRNIPIVWTLHDCWSFTGHCAYFDSPKCDKWQTGCGNCPRRMDYPRSWLMDRSRKNLIEKKEWFSSFNNLTFITPSAWLKDLVEQSYLKEYPVVVVPNGIDLNHFKPLTSTLRQRLKLEGKRVYLSVAMVWDARKGLRDLVDLSHKLKADEVLILIGVSNLQRKGLPKNIIGVKRTSSVKELAEYYSMADVTLVPSYEDNYPTVVLESLACQTRVVAYRTGGIPEMGVEPFVVLINKGDKDHLLEEARAIKTAAWPIDLQRIDKTVSASSIVDIYQRILKK